MNNRRMPDTYQDDEISLVDIWRTLVRHKKVIFLVWGLVSLGGVIAAVLIPDKYAYITRIEMGHLGDEKGNTRLVETADEARIRLVADIIPVTRVKYLSEGKDVPGLDVKIPEKSPSLLLLESRGLAQSGSGHLAFHEAVAEALGQGHQSVSGEAQEALGVRQEAAKRYMADLEDESVLLAAQLKRLEEDQAHVKNRNEQSIASSTRQAEKAAGQKADVTAELVRMMVNNQIEQQRWVVRKDIADNVRAMDAQRRALNLIVSGFEKMRETRIVIPPTQSSGTVAPNRRLIIVLAVFGGLMLGLLSAFFAEFLAKVRKEADTHTA